MEPISISNLPPDNSAPSTSMLNGVYRGRVVGHGQYGTCRIWIPEVYPAEWKLEPKNLPLAEQAQPFVAFGSQPIVDPEDPKKNLPSIGSPGGVYTYPAIGSYVWCFFIRGDIEHPVYFAAVPSTLPDSKANWDQIQLSERAKGYVFSFHLPKDNEEESETGQIEDVRVEVFTKDHDRAVAVKVFGNDADIEKTVKNEIVINKDGITLYTSGNLNINAGMGVNINAQTISLKANNKIIETSETGSIEEHAPLIVADTAMSKEGYFVVEYNERTRGEVIPRKVRWTP